MALASGTFLTYLDNSIVNVALPSIQRSLNASIAGMEWIVSSYILVFAGLMLMGGRIADVFGRRPVLIGGFALFTVASLLAGVSGDEVLLISSRVLQGVGAAMLAPSVFALLPLVFSDTRERNTAMGITSAAAGLALAVGPAAGGFITQYAHWGWIYLINVPFGVIAIALAAWALPPTKAARRRLDLPGVTLSSVTLLALTYALIESQIRGWTPEILAAFALAAAALIAFVVVESRAIDPMIELSLFRSRVFSGGTLVIGMWAFAVFGVYFFTALHLQNILGFTPLEAGAAFVPMALVMAVVAATAGRLSQRVGDAPVVAAALTMMAVAGLGVSNVGPGDGMGDLLPWLVLFGVGSGLIVPLNTAVLGAMPASKEGVASGVLNASREVFGLLGITVLGAVLTSRQSSAQQDGLLPAAAFFDAYRGAVGVAAAVLAVGVPLSLFSLWRVRSTAAATGERRVTTEPVG
ncbi:MFS transporter [Streptosporangium sp. NPDC048865]|uniref:MFS transporter n=1 Tax=Streptosporangium sp. NPDC048865 TaxID=3155766 RepID=UPI003417E752